MPLQLYINNRHSDAAPMVSEVEGSEFIFPIPIYGEIKTRHSFILEQS